MTDAPAAVSGRPFGRGADGVPARLYTLDGGAGVVARVTDMGAALVGLDAPDRSGAAADVVLGFDSAEGYASSANPHFGGTVGRVANRVSGAEFVLDGVRYPLAANEGPNHLHGGGRRGLDRIMWSVEDAGPAAVRLRVVSPAGEEGYPGRLEVTAEFRVAGRVLEIEYRAVADAATPVNMTNHAYFDLAGPGAPGARGRTAGDHLVQVEADAYTPVDGALLPTGVVDPVAGALDLREPRRIGDAPGGYDHNFVLRGSGLRRAAVLHHPDSGRTLEVATDQPCLQLYSGGGIPAGLVGKAGRVHGPGAAVCLEPQGYPDAVNRPEFPPVVLRPGEVYRHRIRFALSAR
ncbi:aldose epimerase family protein [Nocardiopsis coralliicola]